jgi:hypothetical protein
MVLTLGLAINAAYGWIGIKTVILLMLVKQ